MNTPNKCYCDPVKLGCELVKSGKDFENALGALLEAESKKINALVKAFCPQDCCYPVCKDDLLNANKYLSNSLDSIKEIECLVLKKIILGIIAIHVHNNGNDTDEVSPIDKEELIKETIKNVENFNVQELENFNIQDLEGLMKKFLNQ